MIYVWGLLICTLIACAYFAYQLYKYQEIFWSEIGVALVATGAWPLVLIAGIVFLILAIVVLIFYWVITIVLGKR